MNKPKAYADMNLQEKNEYLINEIKSKNKEIEELKENLNIALVNVKCTEFEFAGYKEAVVQFTGDDLREQMSDLDRSIRTEIVKIKNTLDMFERKLKK